MFRRRRTLSRTESAELFERQREIQREAMTAEDVQALMRKAIEEGLDKAGVITGEDLRRANVPAQAITMHFGRIMREVIAARKLRGVHA